MSINAWGEIYQFLLLQKFSQALSIPTPFQTTNIKRVKKYTEVARWGHVQTHLHVRTFSPWIGTLHCAISITKGIILKRFSPQQKIERSTQFYLDCQLPRWALRVRCVQPARRRPPINTRVSVPINVTVWDLREEPAQYDHVLYYSYYNKHSGLLHRDSTRPARYYPEYLSFYRCPPLLARRENCFLKKVQKYSQFIRYLRPDAPKLNIHDTNVYYHEESPHCHQGGIYSLSSQVK